MRFKILMPIFFQFLLAISVISTAAVAQRGEYEFEKGETVAIIGNTFVERMGHYGYFETFLHARFPEHNLTIRNLGWSADEIDLKPRENKVPTEDDWLTQLKPDTLIACFGLNESYKGMDGVPEFEAKLASYIDHLLSVNEEVETRLILISPIAYEQMSDQIPDAHAKNRDIGAYSRAMEKVAAEKEVGYVNLFTPTLLLFRESVASGKYLTINGIHLNKLGYWHTSRLLAQAFGFLEPQVQTDPEDWQKAEDLRECVNEKNHQFFYRYRPLNSCYIWGQRKEPFGIHNFPQELQEWEEITARLDEEIWKEEIDPAAIWSKEPEYIEGGYDPYTPLPIDLSHEVEVPTIEEMLASFTVAGDYEISLFASEKDFPIASPMGMEFDGKGRLWISNAPTYPHLVPGKRPNDSIIILEDTDKDGKADSYTIFASGLYIPTGFAIGDGGAYIAQQPDLLHFKDVDGDGAADLKKTVLHGFGNADSHHSISAFTWEPGGGFYMHEGVFLYTSVETPWGPFRAHDASVLRYFPNAHRFDVLSHCSFANPWGHAVDRWGQSILNDASGGRNHYFGHVIANAIYPHKNPKVEHFFRPGRPSAGVEILSSRHFPDEVQGSFVVNNTIGFHGTFWRGLGDRGSGYEAIDLGEEMLQSSLESFRPVSVSIGPDGALYILDFCNPIIGHMQYSLRDERRDHAHGRVWRITHKTRPLADLPRVADQSIPELLELLEEQEFRTREFARRALQEMDADQVLPEVEKWVKSLDESETEYEHHLLEALWVVQGLNVYNRPLLDRLLAAKDFNARAAAGRVVRYWITMGFIEDPLPILEALVQDPHMRVRLEGITACGFVPSSSAAGIALIATQMEMDEGIRKVLEGTLEALKPYGRPTSIIGRAMVVAILDDEELKEQPLDRWVAAERMYRPTLSKSVRRKALDQLSKEKGVAQLEVLLDVLIQASYAERSVPHLLQEFLSSKPSDLASLEKRLRDLLAEPQTAALRQACIAALIKAGGEKGFDETAKVAETRDILFSSMLLDPSDPSLAGAAKTIKRFLPPEGDSLEDQPVMGRYVRIDLPDGDGPLTLAEVQVMSAGENVAPGGEASQSTTAHGGVASRAIDGQRSGTFRKEGQTHTDESDKNPWWEIDLGKAYVTEEIVLWNRTDCCGDRLEGYRVRVFDKDYTEIWSFQAEGEVERENRVVVGPPDIFPLQKLAMRAGVAITCLRAELFRRLSNTIEHYPDEKLTHAARVAMNSLAYVEWPKGYDRYAVAAKVDPEKMALGKDVYFREQMCATCHQPNGLGMDPGYPPLAESPWTAGSKERFIKIALNGLQGPVLVNGKEYSSAMAPLGALVNDEEAAAVLTYVRTSFGNLSTEITAEEVARVREETKDMKELWTARGLLESHPAEGDATAMLADSKSDSSARVFVKMWAMADFDGDGEDLSNGRSAAKGKEAFVAAGCTSCHALGGEGNNIGPDLAGVIEKYKGMKLLQQILEPSSEINEEFKSQIVETVDEEMLIGIVVEEDSESISILTNPNSPLDLTVVSKADVVDRRAASLSSMPTGLLITLEKEEILDLIAFLETGGKVAP